MVDVQDIAGASMDGGQWPGHCGTGASEGDGSAGNSDDDLDLGRAERRR